MEGIRDEMAEIVEPEGSQHDLMHPRIGFADRLERPQQRVCGTDLIVPIGPDHQQRPHLRVGDQMLEEIERRCIQPLQIVEKQGQRVLLPREHAKEAPKYHLEAILRVLGRQVRDRGLLSDHQLQLWNQVHDELTIGTQRVAERLPPAAKFHFALAQEGADKALEGLGKRGVWDVALVLVEFAGSKQPTRRNQHFVELIHHRGLANPGVAVQEHQLRGVVSQYAIERSEQRDNLALPPVELLWNQQPIRDIVGSQREQSDTTVGLPSLQAAPEIAGHAGRSLIPLLGRLRQQLHDDR